MGITDHLLVLLLTGHQITKANGCHRNEAKVEAIEERPVILPQQQQPCSSGQVDAQKAHGQYGIEPGLAHEVGELWLSCRDRERGFLEKESGSKEATLTGHVLAKDGNGTGKESAPVGDDGEREGDANEGEANAEDAPTYGDRHNVAIACSEGRRLKRNIYNDLPYDISLWSNSASSLLRSYLWWLTQLKRRTQLAVCSSARRALESLYRLR